MNLVFGMFIQKRKQQETRDGVGGVEWKADGRELRQRKGSHSY